jgi:hypothetical protein
VISIFSKLIHHHESILARGIKAINAENFSAQPGEEILVGLFCGTDRGFAFQGRKGAFRTPVARLSQTGKAFGFAVFTESTAPAHR